MNSHLFILGADDPEMREIEKILAYLKYDVQYATKDGKRVHPGNAYLADMIEVSEGVQLVLVECQPIYHAQNVMRVDHHRPGDPGYNMPPEKFWEASSLGQVCELVWEDARNWQLLPYRYPDQDLKVLAAMDHCPAAAIRGECPGVSAQEVLNRKVAEIAAATGHSPQGVLSRVAFFTEKIEEAPHISISMEGGMLMDMREYSLGEGYSLDLLAYQTAALAGGYGVLLRHRDAPGKPEKWTISGHASPEIIEAFMKYWAPSQGLTGIYGVPSRGYAGGYLPEREGE